MSSRDSIGYGLVGVGAIAEVHAAALARVRGARLRAVCGRDFKKTRRFADRHGIDAERDLGALLARSDVDVLCVTTASGAHGDCVLAGFAAGKHVLCEKPLEISLTRVDRLLVASRRHDRLLGVVMPARFGDGAQAVKRAVDQGLLGRLTLCSAYVKWWRTEDYYSASSWRGTWTGDGGGALINQGIHAVDLLQWFVGEVRRATAMAATLAHPAIEVEDTLTAALEFSNGALGTVECATSCAPGGARRIELCGDRGTIVLEDDRITRWDLAKSGEGEVSARPASASKIGGGGSDPLAIGVEGHEKVIGDMTDAVRNRHPPQVSGEDARKTLAIIEMIYVSSSMAATRAIRLAEKSQSGR